MTRPFLLATLFACACPDGGPAPPNGPAARRRPPGPTPRSGAGVLAGATAEGFARALALALALLEPTTTREGSTARVTVADSGERPRGEVVLEFAGTKVDNLTASPSPRRLASHTVEFAGTKVDNLTASPDPVTAGLAPRPRQV